MTKRAAVNQGERGAALVTVLTMVAIMSALAVVAVDAASMSVRRTFNQTRMEQTHWYLLGAEAFAIGKLEEMRRAAREGAAPAGDWHGRVLSFPLDDGMMQVALYDGGNCFNLNSVVRQAEDDAATANAGGDAVCAAA
ncbi:MAG: type II secretion system protein GspK [Terricaulis sp.]|nr:type II secretion system protein GspK [Terricaulis sp.]